MDKKPRWAVLLIIAGVSVWALCAGYAVTRLYELETRYAADSRV